MAQSIRTEIIGLLAASLWVGACSGRTDGDSADPPQGDGDAGRGSGDTGGQSGDGDAGGKTGDGDDGGQTGDGDGDTGGQSGDGDAVMGGASGDGDDDSGGTGGDGDSETGGSSGDGDGDGDGPCQDGRADCPCYDNRTCDDGLSCLSNTCVEPRSLLRAGGEETLHSTADTECDPGIAPTSQMARLTNSQYDNTIRDLLGVTQLIEAAGAAPSTLLLPHTGSSIGQDDQNAYDVAAQMIAVQVMGDPQSKANFLACDEAQDGCLTETIRAFGRRAFRRPLTDTEVTQFESLTTSDGVETPTQAAELLLYAFLISPSFLMRVELSTDRQDSEGNYLLSSHEVASRLSYLLWGSIPDAELSREADSDLLQTEEQISEQAKRMLSDAKAQPRMAEFHRSYLEMTETSHWGKVRHDTDIFPSYEEDSYPSMLAETEAFFDSVTFSGGSFQDLFLDPTAFVNSKTAATYGLDPSSYGDELTAVNLDPQWRPGFLTRLAFLDSFSGFDSTSPFLRGSFILSSVLGIDVGPPGEFDNVGSVPPGDWLTNREKRQSLTAPERCAGCHQVYINPPGFVMENYDAVGSFQTIDPLGGPIDTVASVVLDDNMAHVITTPLELMVALGESKEAQRNYLRKLVAFAFERLVNQHDSCVVNELAAKMGEGELSILDLVAELTRSPSFRSRSVL